MEIERKFLLSASVKAALGLHPELKHYDILQGYLCADGRRTVRVRLRDNEGFLTIKGPSTTDGLARFEWEKTIDAKEALQLFALCLPGKIHKTRYILPLHSAPSTKHSALCTSTKHSALCTLHLEMDIFHGENDGLIMAEIEFSSEQAAASLSVEDIAKSVRQVLSSADSADNPSAIELQEVTGDVRFYNAYLSSHPFTTW